MYQSLGEISPSLNFAQAMGHFWSHKDSREATSCCFLPMFTASDTQRNNMTMMMQSRREARGREREEEGREIKLSPKRMIPLSAICLKTAYLLQYSLLFPKIHHTPERSTNHSSNKKPLCCPLSLYLWDGTKTSRCLPQYNPILCFPPYLHCLLRKNHTLARSISSSPFFLCRRGNKANALAILQNSPSFSLSLTFHTSPLFLFLAFFHPCLCPALGGEGTIESLCAPGSRHDDAYLDPAGRFRVGGCPLILQIPCLHTAAQTAQQELFLGVF